MAVFRPFDRDGLTVLAGASKLVLSEKSELWELFDNGRKVSLTMK
jgi:hypothetical protein